MCVCVYVSTTCIYQFENVRILSKKYFVLCENMRKIECRSKSMMIIIYMCVGYMILKRECYVSSVQKYMQSFLDYIHL